MVVAPPLLCDLLMAGYDEVPTQAGGQITDDQSFNVHFPLHGRQRTAHRNDEQLSADQRMN
jgi:hypothetical protein